MRAARERTSTGEFHQFLGTARGSLLEVQTLLEISASLDFIKPEELKRLFAEKAICRNRGAAPNIERTDFLCEIYEGRSIAACK